MRKNGLTTEEFVRCAKMAHGEKYTYGKSEYVDSRTKVVITCPIHGDFEMRPNAHFGAQRQGCKACGGRPDMNTAAFILKSKQLFPDRFDYSETQYINATTDVTIICKTHGAFTTRPANHYIGRGGCKTCGGRPDKDTASFVLELQLRFGNKYDLSRVEYNGAFEEVEVGCSTHGFFKKPASKLLNTEGCPKCAKRSTAEFAELAEKVHGGKFDYSSVDYRGSMQYVTIICPRHGEFEQTPNRHLDGRGCPACGVESNLLANRSADDRCILYFATMIYKGHAFWKIGITTKGLAHRYRLLKRDHVAIERVEEVTVRLGDALLLEDLILRENKSFLSYRGHILKYSKGGTECFDSDVLGPLSLAEYIQKKGVAILSPTTQEDAIEQSIMDNI